MDYNYKQIAEGARAFFNVAIDYIEKPDRTPSIAMIPYHVCLTFSCELFMKAIIVHDFPDMTQQELQKLGHNLNSLYEKLPSNRKEKITREIPDLKIMELRTKRVNSYKAALKSNLPYQVKTLASYRLKTFPKTFLEMLFAHSNGFKEWRYFYENIGVCEPISFEEEFMYPFALVLHNIICDIYNGKD